MLRTRDAIDDSMTVKFTKNPLTYHVTLLSRQLTPDCPYYHTSVRPQHLMLRCGKLGRCDKLHFFYLANYKVPYYNNLPATIVQCNMYHISNLV